MLSIGYTANVRELLAKKLWLGGGGVVILRSFTSEVDKESGLPVKELRGWIIEKKVADSQVLAASGISEQLVATRLLPDELYQAYTTSGSNTSERQAVEQAVRFC